jgi:hypothetical protein
LSKGAKLEDLGEATEGFDDSGWISLGDEPDFLERHGIYVGHAWYRGKVDLTAAEAANPGPLTLGTVSDFAGIYINGKYLLTLSPLGTEVDSGSKDVDYKFQIPAGVLHAGTNTIAIRNEIWGHGSFMFPRGTVKRVALGALGPFVVPGMRASIPALGFDSMKGVAGPARLGQKAITQWKLRAGLGGEGNGFTSGGSFGVGATPAAGASGAQGADFPMALKAGEVSWYRTVFSTKDLPSPSTWSAPAALVLKGRSAKASVYLNGRLVARWLSDNDWLKRGSWLQPTRNMWVQLTADEYPLPRESMKEGDNTLVIALEDTSDATVGAPPGTVAQAELQFAKEIKVWNGQGIDYADRVHQRVSVQGSNPR